MAQKIINSLIQFLLYPHWTFELLLIKIFYLVISAIFLVFIIWALIKTEWLKRLFLWDLKEFLTFRAYLVKKYLKEWQKIKKRLESGQESEAKMALIEAHSLLDKVLENLGYQGENLAERLDKLTIEILPNLEEVREVEKIHSDIIHDPSYRLDLNEAKRAILIYEKALAELDAL